MADEETIAPNVTDADDPPVPRDETEDLPEEAARMGRDALREMTGKNDPVARRDRTPTTEEEGGPYVVTRAAAELADDDESVDEDWEPAAKPAPMRSE